MHCGLLKCLNNLTPYHTPLTLLLFRGGIKWQSYERCASLVNHSVHKPSGAVTERRAGGVHSEIRIEVRPGTVQIFI